MITIIAIIGIFTLMSGVPSLAAEKVLTNQQLDAITAGTLGDGVAQFSAKNTEQSIANNTITPQVNNNEIQNEINFGHPNAENVVNVPTVNVDGSIDASQNVNSKNDILVLKDFAQENAKAVNIENSIQSQVVNGVNAHVNGLLSNGSSGGSLNNLHQTNIITVNGNN